MPQPDLPIRPPDEPAPGRTPITIRVAPAGAVDSIGSRAWRAWVDGEPDVSGHGHTPDMAVGHLVRLRAGRLGLAIVEDQPVG